jgi:transcriptional regulator with XRE-family HTH domain
MGVLSKRTLEAMRLGGELRGRRAGKGLTLEQVAQEVGIHAAQLSRFERGEFVRMSANLQKYLAFLQIGEPNDSQSLAERLIAFCGRSTKHREAALAIVSALEQL